MKKRIVLSLSLLVAALSFSLAVGDEVKSLRKNEIAGPEDAPVDGTWKTKDAKVARTFIHQPPVIPHSIDGFEIHAATRDNDCLNCHGMEGTGAPKPFKTHYLDRDGKVTETVAARWWFCTNCHIGQAEVKPLVENTFSGNGEKKK